MFQLNMSDRKMCLTSFLSFKFTNKFSGIGIKTSERINISFKQTSLLKISQIHNTDIINHPILTEKPPPPLSIYMFKEPPKEH